MICSLEIPITWDPPGLHESKVTITLDGDFRVLCLHFRISVFTSERILRRLVSRTFSIDGSNVKGKVAYSLAKET